jgi:hypothetical protein
MGTLERSDQGSALVRREDFGLATSPAEEVAIAQRIRGASASFFWSTRLLPGPRRNAMQALYGSCREFGDIAVGEALRTLKLALLAEWSAEITLLYAGRPQHVITRALRDAVERFDLRYGDFLAIIDGRKMDSGDRHPGAVFRATRSLLRAKGGSGQPHRLPHLGRSAAGRRPGGGCAWSRHAAHQHPARSRLERRLLAQGELSSVASGYRGVEDADEACSFYTPSPSN